MRDTLNFTIDPKDADFDDALSFKKLENGNEIGIHIADVSYYLEEGSILDDEAYQRATPHLVDRVVPMLPEVLSNFACSLTK
jgi:ribonuclease R